MTYDRPNKNEPGEVDKAASAACTRSGAFALVLTVTLLLLIPNWVQRRNELAFSTYVEYRLDLSTRIENLDDNPKWKDYATHHENTESMSIRKLLAESLGTIEPVPLKPQPEPPPKTTKEHKSKSAQSSAKTDPQKPQPPVLLNATIVPAPLSDTVPPIIDLVKKLNDSELLTHSRRVSNFYGFSIGRWAYRRNNLTYRNMLNTGCFKKEQWELGTKSSDDFVPMIDNDALVDCLTLRDVREIAPFELPTFSNQPIEGKIQKDVEVSPSSLVPRNLYLASFLVQLLLFFVMVHFVAYAREATSSKEFPVKGTLFSAFGGSIGTLLVFFMALWTPLGASVALAVVSRKWPLLFCTTLIAVTVLSAYFVFYRKGFFENVNPQLLASLLNFSRKEKKL